MKATLDEGSAMIWPQGVLSSCWPICVLVEVLLLYIGSCVSEPDRGTSPPEVDRQHQGLILCRYRVYKRGISDMFLWPYAYSAKRAALSRAEVRW